MRQPALLDQKIKPIGPRPGVDDGLFVEENIRRRPERRARFRGGILIHEIKFAPE